MAGPHALGELLLRKPELCTALDDEAHDRLVGRQAFLGSPILPARAARPPATRLGHGPPERSDVRLSRTHASQLINIGKLARLEIAGNGFDERSRMLQSFVDLRGVYVERLVLALIPEIAQSVELVEMLADVEVVESGQ